MKLNFTISELIKSDVATKSKINNIPQSADIIDNLLLLILNVLQPLRNYVGRPVIITSGYRSTALNKKVGGVANSQHLTGQAADFVIQGLTIEEGIRAVKNSGVEFDQLIHEGTWIHISYKKTGNRKQILYL